MMKNWGNNGTEEIGLVTPTPGDDLLDLPFRTHRAPFSIVKYSNPALCGIMIVDNGHF